jgi:hypothetical protein
MNEDMPLLLSWTIIITIIIFLDNHIHDPCGFGAMSFLRFLSTLFGAPLQSLCDSGKPQR